ncbi:metallophosphoesterase family protein [Humitalea sp. 24SJ18S-53]|uniref:metallophosphoesterase family protein n=1 Tax=Humitalea sp. 24SJ18S-53 TaxID=3422307 RepID=UPI003D66667E
MRIALLADVHANLEALEACLADAAARGVTRLVFLGDLVGYGADPLAVLERVRGLMEQGALALRGNHDEGALRGPEGFSADAADAIRWTAARLKTLDRALLEALPLTLAEEDRLYTHADASAPAAWRYVLDARAARRSLEACDARLVFCGHTHSPMLFGLHANGLQACHKPPADVPMPLLASRRWLGVIGSVGQPRDGNPAACYGLLDTVRSSCAWVRVPYDIGTAAAKIKAAGLPPRLAARLFEGL